jgi:hypothetical protein
MNEVHFSFSRSFKADVNTLSEPFQLFSLVSAADWPDKGTSKWFKCARSDKRTDYSIPTVVDRFYKSYIHSSRKGKTLKGCKI